MLDRIVLTGAAGALGSRLRAPLAGLARSLVSTDRVAAPETPANETWVEADLADRAAVERLMEGATMVVHFGAIADEAPWDDILRSNIVGAHNVWEAAWRAGARRVVYASSIHAVGMHPKTERIGVDAPHRPRHLLRPVEVLRRGHGGGCTGRSAASNACSCGSCPAPSP